MVGAVNLPARMPVHASEMFAKNLYSFTAPLLAEGAVAIDWSDEVIAGTALTHDGRVVHAGVAGALGLAEPPAAAPLPTPPAPTTEESPA